jgi:uncharacterized protein (TIGR02757 family)
LPTIQWMVGAARDKQMTPDRRSGLGPHLLELERQLDRRARMAADPVELVHRYGDVADVEVSALLSAAVAYGRVDLFKPRLARLLDALGPAPGAAARDLSEAELRQRCASFAYRMTGAEEVARLLSGAGAIIRRHGTLGAAFTRAFAAAGEPTVRGALSRFSGELLDPVLPSAGPLRRRLQHLWPHPDRGSACKRPNLMLRWLVRGPDGVDLGLWRGVPKSALVVPLDTHVHRIARLVGLTARRDVSWRTAEEITAGLRALDPDDPVRFDFPLSHLGISKRCRARPDPACCAGCPLRPVCAVWNRPASGNGQR